MTMMKCSVPKWVYNSRFGPIPTSFYLSVITPFKNAQDLLVTGTILLYSVHSTQLYSELRCEWYTNIGIIVFQKIVADGLPCATSTVELTNSNRTETLKWLAVKLSRVY